MLPYGLWVLVFAVAFVFGLGLWFAVSLWFSLIVLGLVWCLHVALFLVDYVLDYLFDFAVLCFVWLVWFPSFGFDVSLAFGVYLDGCVALYFGVA